MNFQHSAAIWRDFPELAAGALFAQGITRDARVEASVARFNAIAQQRLATTGEGELPEIQAWRRAFSRMGLKPTQYRCASESLLRRFRKEGALPQLHPLVDLCNSISLAFAIPVAALDVTRISGDLEVGHASGDEVYLAFSGATENPQPGEVTFIDGAGRAHARRWTHRQSAYSAVRDETAAVLIVAEAMHGGASDDVAKLLSMLAQELDAIGAAAATQAILSPASPRFSF